MLDINMLYSQPDAVPEIEAAESRIAEAAAGYSFPCATCGEPVQVDAAGRGAMFCSTECSDHYWPEDEIEFDYD